MDEDVKHLFSYYPKDIKKIYIYEDKTDKKDTRQKTLKWFTKIQMVKLYYTESTIVIKRQEK